jgi:hypothetical protein
VNVAGAPEADPDAGAELSDSSLEAGGVGRDDAGEADEQAATRMNERGMRTESRRRIAPVWAHRSDPSRLRKQVEVGRPQAWVAVL